MWGGVSHQSRCLDAPCTGRTSECYSSGRSARVTRRWRKGEFEAWCTRLSSEELLEIVSRRGRERKLLKEVLTDTARLHPEVRTFLEEQVRGQPGEDVRILVTRRNQEHSEEERERLARAMRGLLP